MTTTCTPNLTLRAQTLLQLLVPGSQVIFIYSVELVNPVHPQAVEHHDSTHKERSVEHAQSADYFRILLHIERVL